MIKKIATIGLYLVIAVSSVSLFASQKVYANEAKIATLSNQPVYYNGEKAYINGYNIDGANYFKIADIGKLLNFDVVWNDNNKMIEVFYDKPYSASKNLDFIEPSKATENQKTKQAISNRSKVRIIDDYFFSDGYENAKLDSYPIDDIETYNIDGYNYFKLRNVVGYGKSEVQWDEKLQVVQINTKEILKEQATTEKKKQEISASSNGTARLETTPKEVLERDLDIWQDENYQLSEYEKEVLRLVNIERKKIGLNEVTMDVNLSKISRIKAREMATMNYFSHESPNYGQALEMCRKFGIEKSMTKDNLAGEIIGDELNASEVVNRWMESKGHKATILDENRTKAGFGYFYETNSDFKHYHVFMVDKI